MPMLENANRTFVCSILFLDIIEYSKRSVADQIRQKERFNADLSQAISQVAVDDRIILDTGDGAALSFLGDPEDAMFVALGMRDAVISRDARGEPLAVRFGINLGPVRLVKDINGQPNIIGDGINVAQRVMSFADSGQILVSRSYYEVMARMSEDYAGMFHYEGARTDKHVREHEVYAVGAAPRRYRPSGSAAAAPPRVSRFARLHPRAMAMALGVNSKLLLAAPLAFIAIVGTAPVLRNYRSVNTQEQPVAAATSAQPAAATKEAEALPVPTGKAERTKPAHKAAPSVKPTLARAEDAAAANVPAAQAVIAITALPWAEVYLDGELQGVSPPLRSLPAAAGKHRVELRNSAFPAHVETVDLGPGGRVTIRHRFKR